MAFYHRKLLLLNPKQKEHGDPPPSQVSTTHDVFTSLIVAVCFLGAIFLFLAYYNIRIYLSKGNTTTTNSATVENENVNAENEIHGPAEEVDHPIWYIRTVGLPETAIDSISTFKFKRQRFCSKENSDCCVCLNEFREDESLRLLPNCGHAFHVPCIDTWLRSHTNCPICRSPVVTTGGGGGGGSDEVELVVAGSSGPTEENRVDNESGDFIESDEKGSEVFSRNGEFRVSSDHLGESR